MSTSAKSLDESARWVQHVHEAQSKRSPEAWEAARSRIEQARQHEVSYRKVKAAKGHAVRCRALAAEGLRQMAVASAPQEHMAVQARWQSAQVASKKRQDRSMHEADDAFSAAPARASAPVALLCRADEEEAQAMEEVAELVGAEDARAMAVVGAEGLAAAPGHRESGVAARARVGARAGAAATTVETLLAQLRREPKDEAECAAKFMLYEGYASEVEQMRSTLFTFHEESRPTVPAAVASDMDKQIKGIDTTEAMGIPDRAREWFVYHMMRQAERNNLKMAGILENFEKTLEFLAANDQDECPVCLEAFTEDGVHVPETLSCCHKVCKECWDNWSTVMRGRPFCPLCRHDEFLGAVAARVSGSRVPAPVDSDED